MPGTTSRRLAHRVGRPHQAGRPCRGLSRHELGPFSVTATLHRPPGTGQLASLSRHPRFVPMTDAVVALRGASAEGVHEDVVLVNREQVTKTRPLAVVPVYTGGTWPSSPDPAVVG